MDNSSSLLKADICLLFFHPRKKPFKLLRYNQLEDKNLHCPFFVVFEVLCDTGGGRILILRQRNLSKHCLLRFLYLNIKIFTVCALKRFNDCDTKLDHAEFFP